MKFNKDKILNLTKNDKSKKKKIKLAREEYRNRKKNNIRSINLLKDDIKERAKEGKNNIRINDFTYFSSRNLIIRTPVVVSRYFRSIGFHSYSFSSGKLDIIIVGWGK